MHAIGSYERRNVDHSITMLASHRAGGRGRVGIVRAQKPGHLIGDDTRPDAAHGRNKITNQGIIATNADEDLPCVNGMDES